MTLNFAFFTAEPVSVLSETIAKNTCKMVSETKGDEKETVGDIPDGKGAGPRCPSPMVKIVKNCKHLGLMSSYHPISIPATGHVHLRPHLWKSPSETDNGDQLLSHRGYPRLSPFRLRYYFTSVFIKCLRYNGDRHLCEEGKIEVHWRRETEMDAEKLYCNSQAILT